MPLLHSSYIYKDDTEMACLGTRMYGQGPLNPRRPGLNCRPRGCKPKAGPDRYGGENQDTQTQALLNGGSARASPSQGAPSVHHGFGCAAAREVQALCPFVWEVFPCFPEWSAALFLGSSPGAMVLEMELRGRRTAARTVFRVYY